MDIYYYRVRQWQASYQLNNLVTKPTWPAMGGHLPIRPTLRSTRQKDQAFEVTEEGRF